MASARQFIVGKEDYPAWFREQASKGRVKLNHDDDGVLQSITVYAPTKSYTAKPGDVILMLKSGMTVLDKASAIKYGTQPQKKEVERDV